METTLRFCLLPSLALLFASSAVAESPKANASTTQTPSAFGRLMSQSFKVRGSESGGVTIPSRNAAPASGDSIAPPVANPSWLRDPAVGRVQHTQTSELPPEPSPFRLAQSDLLDDLMNDLSQEEAKPEAAPADAADAGNSGADEGTETSTEELPASEDAAIAEESADVGPTEAAPTPSFLKPEAQRKPVKRTTKSAAGKTLPADTIPNESERLAARRAAYESQPFTLGDILNDDDQQNCECEREFCQAMWQCAGGRGGSWFSLWHRDFARNRSVLWGRNAGCGNHSSPMANFQCSSRGGGCQNGNCQGNHGYGGGYGASYVPRDGEPTPALPLDGGMHDAPGNDIQVPLQEGPLPDLQSRIDRARPRGTVGKPIMVADRRVDGPDAETETR